MKRMQMLCLLLLVLASTTLYVIACAKPAIIDESDGANAEVAYRMVHTGDWVTPYFGSVRRLNGSAVFARRYSQTA